MDNSKQAERQHKIKDKSPFVTYVTTAVACILICVAGFTFLIFRTDTIISADGNVIRLFTSYVNRTTVDQTISIVESYREQTNLGSTEAESPSGSVTIPGVNYQIRYGDFYSTLTLKAGTTHTDVNGIPLYSEWPWGSDSVNVRFCDIRAMHDTLVSDIADTLGIDVSNVRHNTTLSVDSDRYVGSSITDVDGVGCVPMCFYPAWVSTDYYTRSWALENPAWSSSMAASVYACLVLEDSSGSNFLIPIVQSDNKGHTFPGGVNQTFIKQINGNGSSLTAQMANKVTGTAASNLSIVSGGAAVGSGDGPFYSGSLRDVLSVYDASGDSALYYGSGLCKIKFSIEVNGAFQSKINNLINSGYTVKGVAVKEK